MLFPLLISFLKVRRDYLHYIKKYNRFAKRHRNVPAHCSPAFKVKEGDVVTIGQCRYVSFNAITTLANEVLFADLFLRLSVSMSCK